MSKKFAMILSVYLLIGFGVAVFYLIDNAGRGMVSEATFGAAAGKGIAWPVTLVLAIADGF